MLKASYKDKPIILDILVNSFDTNGSVNFVVKQDKKRKERIKALMDYSLEQCYEFGEVLLSEDKDACALILYPDKKRTTLKSILWDIQLAFNCIGLLRLSKVLEREKMIKSHYPTTPLLYLWFIGVREQSQQKGRGSELIQYIIKQSQASSRPIYLETSMPENLSFYHKHGFELYKELDKPYPLFLLRRNLW